MEGLVKKCGQNRISQALLLMQYATELNSANRQPTDEQTTVLLVSVLCTVYILQCTMYSVLCTVYYVQCTMYSVLCTVYYVQCTMYSVLCTVYYVQCTMYSVLCTVYYVQCTMYSVLCTVYYVQCTMYSVLCTVYYVQCTMYSVLCTVYYVQCTMYSVLCTVYCVDCTIYSVLCTFQYLVILSVNCEFENILLQKARKLLRNVEVEEKQLYQDNWVEVEAEDGVGEVVVSTVPPAPRLLCRTDRKMVLTPVPFVPTSGQKVFFSLPA